MARSEAVSMKRNRLASSSSSQQRNNYKRKLCKILEPVLRSMA